MSEWQPIETAPKSASDAGKDRHYVLVVYPGWKDGIPAPFVMMAYQDSLGWDTGAWRLHEQPTHWMPLPEPPKPWVPLEGKRRRLSRVAQDPFSKVQRMADLYEKLGGNRRITVSVEDFRELTKDSRLIAMGDRLLYRGIEIFAA